MRPSSLQLISANEQIRASLLEFISKRPILAGQIFDVAETMILDEANELVCTIGKLALLKLGELKEEMNRG